VDAFEQFIRGGLAQAGLEADDLDVEIARYIGQLYGPEMEALAQLPMTGLWPEPDLDPARAPRASAADGGRT
jgi:hypothetical protein